MKVSEVMTTDVLTTRADVPLKEAAAQLARQHVSGLPVVDDGGAVVGVISEADVIAKEGTQPRHRGAMAWLLEPADPWLENRLQASTVADAMSAPAVVIGPGKTVADAATLMLEEGVNRLPVVDGGRLVGIVTRADLVRAFARTDDEIRTEIEDDVVQRIMWLEPTDVRVTVDHGEVTLAGRVKTRADAELLPVLVRRVPGVVGVESTLATIDHD